VLRKTRELGLGKNTKPVPKEVMAALQAAKARDKKAEENATTDFSDVPPTLFSGLLGFQIEGLM
jgi:hypothetical protein